MQGVAQHNRADDIKKRHLCAEWVAGLTIVCAELGTEPNKNAFRSKNSTHTITSRNLAGRTNSKKSAHEARSHHLSKWGLKRSKGSAQLNALLWGKAWQEQTVKTTQGAAGTAERTSSGRSLAVTGTSSPRIPLPRSQMCGQGKTYENGQYA